MLNCTNMEERIDFISKEGTSLVTRMFGHLSDEDGFENNLWRIIL